MAKALAYGLPGNLEECCKLLNLTEQKDNRGHQVMMKMCKPRGYLCVFHGEQKKYCCGNCDHHFWSPVTARKDFETLYDYNIQDIKAEVELDHRLNNLSKTEQRIWEMDQRMNQQGVQLDIEAVLKADEFAQEHKSQIMEPFAELTGGLRPTQREKVRLWLGSRGYPLKNMQAPTIAELREKLLPEDVEQVLDMYEACSKASLAKYKSMQVRSDDQGVYREMFRYHGAHTGRWSGQGVQLQNLKRPGKHNIETAVGILKQVDYEDFKLIYGDVSKTLSLTSRGMVIAKPRHRFLGGDYKQIEARVNAWFGGQQDKLDDFAADKDIYCIQASSIYGYEVTPDMENERQVGKVADLAFGYQGGIHAGAKMGKGDGLNLGPLAPTIWDSAEHEERERAEYCYMLYCKAHPDEPMARLTGLAWNVVKDRWRQANPMIVKFWNDLENAVISAIADGKVHELAGLRIFMHEEFLCVKLPSKRIMRYPFPKLREGKRGKISIIYYSAKYGWVTTYGGSLCENVVQATARDVMTEAMLRLEDIYPILFHVHDEMVSEVPDGEGDLEEFIEMAKIIPAWAEGIPVDISGWEGVRYGIKG